MAQDLRDFWHRFQLGVDVAVAGSVPDKLLGVRDGFLRYFRERYAQAGRIWIDPQKESDDGDAPVPLEDLEILALARRKAADLETGRPEDFAFYVGSETGILAVRLDDQVSYFVRTWTVIRGLGEEAWGSSGSLQMPARLINGLDDDRIPFAVPGTRRHGGMVSSLTGGIESRRSATALSTFYALSTLTYGLHVGESRPERPGRPSSRRH